jgi:hypothetical protein
LQHDLPGRVVGQILARTTCGDALRRIVYHHGQLIGPQTICTLRYEIAHFV